MPRDAISKLSIGMFFYHAFNVYNYLFGNMLLYSYRY